MSDRMEVEIVCPNDHNQTVYIQSRRIRRRVEIRHVGSSLQYMRHGLAAIQ
jgi:hypothetical protein